MSAYLIKSRERNMHSGGFFKLDGYYESLNENEIELTNSTSSFASIGGGAARPQNPATTAAPATASITSKTFQFDQKSILNLKPTLTDSYLVDDELHKVIELCIRDYLESWYKPQVSNKEDYVQSIRVLIYSAIRHVNQCLKTVDWEHFFVNVLAQNLLVQLRMYKKARERVRMSTSATVKNIVSGASGRLLGFKSLHACSHDTLDALFSTIQAIGQANEATLNDLFFEVGFDLI
jgi:hypothetical protein